MPSSTSNFKRILRLPRLFFRTPTEAESVHGGPPLEFERPIPQIPWRGITVIVVLVVIAAALRGNFIVARLVTVPRLTTTRISGRMARRRVQPESIVIIGDSRGWFDLDLDELQKGLGKRPVQLAWPEAALIRCWPISPTTKLFTARLFAVSCPACFLPRPGTPPMERGEKNVRRSRTQTPAQRVSQYLAMPLEEHVAFLKDIRSHAGGSSETPAYSKSARCAYSAAAAAVLSDGRPGTSRSHDRGVRATGNELQRRIQQIWIPLFTPPPPPSYVPKEVFMAQIMKAIEQRFQDVASAAQKLRARGGKIVFVRLPSSGRAQSSRGSHDTAQSDLGSSNERHGCARNLFRRFSRASGLQLPRVVALVRR